MTYYNLTKLAGLSGFEKIAFRNLVNTQKMFPGHSDPKMAKMTVGQFQKLVARKMQSVYGNTPVTAENRDAILKLQQERASEVNKLYRQLEDRVSDINDTIRTKGGEYVAFGHFADKNKTVMEQMATERAKKLGTYIDDIRVGSRTGFNTPDEIKSSSISAHKRMIPVLYRQGEKSRGLTQQHPESFVASIPEIQQARLKERYKNLPPETKAKIEKMRADRAQKAAQEQPIIGSATAQQPPVQAPVQSHAEKPVIGSGTPKESIQQPPVQTPIQQTPIQPPVQQAPVQPPQPTSGLGAPAIIGSGLLGVYGINKLLDEPRQRRNAYVEQRRPLQRRD